MSFCWLHLWAAVRKPSSHSQKLPCEVFRKLNVCVEWNSLRFGASILGSRSGPMTLLWQTLEKGGLYQHRVGVIIALRLNLCLTAVTQHKGNLREPLSCRAHERSFTSLHGCVTAEEISIHSISATRPGLQGNFSSQSDFLQPHSESCAAWKTPGGKPPGVFFKISFFTCVTAAVGIALKIHVLTQYIVPSLMESCFCYLM